VAIGGRDGHSAKLFIDDLASRLANRVQLTSTFSSWKAAQASPASTKILPTVLIDTSTTREIDRMEAPSQSSERIWARLCGGSFFHASFTLLCLTSSISFFDVAASWPQVVNRRFAERPFCLDSASLLAYMSIRERIQEVLGKSLVCLPPEAGGEMVRTLLVSREVLDDVQPPFPDHWYGYRLGQFRGTLDAFTEGQWLSVACDPYAKAPWADMAPIDPVDLDIWDIRSMSPYPQIRCFGGWAEKGTFVALNWQWRDDIEDFALEAINSRKIWDSIFPCHPPFRGNTIDDYFKDGDDNYEIV
jgi:hypothetical protein